MTASVPEAVLAGTSRKSRSRWKAEYETWTMTLLLANYVFPGKKI